MALLFIALGALLTLGIGAIAFGIRNTAKKTEKKKLYSEVSGKSASSGVKSLKLYEIDKIQLMFDETPLAINLWLEDKIIICNENAVKMFGFQDKQEYLERYNDLSPEYQLNGKLSKELWQEYYQKALEEGHLCIEWNHRKLNGEIMPCEVLFIRVDYKNMLSMVTYTRDLREIKAAIEEKREANERIQIMFDASPLVCEWLDRGHNILDCNKEALKLFDLPSKRDFLDKYNELMPLYQPCGRLSQEKLFDLAEDAFSKGHCRTEWLYKKLNGELIPSEITMVAVKSNEEDMLVIYVRDLREHKQMMKRVEWHENLLNTVNHTAVVLLSTENEENMRSVIHTGMELLGMTVDVDRVQILQNEVKDGENHFVFKHRWLSDYGKMNASVPMGTSIPYSAHPGWESMFMADECINSPLSMLSQNDQENLKPYNIKTLVVIPLFLQDNFWGCFSLDDCRNERTFTDEELNILRSGGLLIANALLRSDMVSQLEIALKEAREANTAKSKFLATMSHEIRTPMNVILGVTESNIENESHPQEIRDSFQKIYNSGDLLLHIINDILDLSKIEAGKFELVPVKYEIVSLINDAANMNVMKYAHKNLKFNLHADENLPMHLFGDELRLKQIINNLLSNAFKYTDKGEVTLSFEAENTTEESTTLVISVIDTGQGMSPDQIATLFDEYSRFNLEANRTTVGTGLGMAITSNLIKMMEGVLNVESTVGEGSKFTVRIPQKVTGNAVLGKETMEKFKQFRYTDRVNKTKAKVIKEPMPYGKVLVVDDMKSNLDVAKLLMSPYKLQFETADSGFEAIEKIKEGKVYDIVFMDHMMPKMDGMETTKCLRDFGYHFPIIALTANAIAGQQEIFLENGFDGFISKPIDIRQLNDVLIRYVRDKNNIVQQPAEQLPEKIDITIPQLNTKIGLSLYDGDIDAYRSVLRSFISNAESMIESLSGLSEEILRVSLEHYLINIHGLKGISSGIGAEKLRDLTENFEEMANKGDFAGIISKNPELIDSIKNIASGIKVWLGTQKEVSAKPVLSSPNRMLLSRLRKGCENYDMESIDDIMDELEKSEYIADNALILWLRNKINKSDFTSAYEKLSEYAEV